MKQKVDGSHDFIVPMLKAERGAFEFLGRKRGHVLGDHHVLNAIYVEQGVECLRRFGRFASHSFAWQATGLLHPIKELGFIQLTFVNIEVAHVLVFGFSRGDRTE